MALKKRTFFPPFVNDIYLMLTERCPMRCEYCYIRHRADGESMTKETMDKVMEKVSGRPRIIFFGGEPLLKVDEMEWFIQKYGNSCCGFQTVTSGTVNFDEFYRRIYQPNKERFELQMSWDGTYGTRKLAGNVNNSTAVYKNIEKLLKSNDRFQVRSVINDTNIDHLFELYERYSKLSKEYSEFCADMTLAHQESYNNSFPEKLKHELKKILRRIEADFSAGKKPCIEQWILNYISSALNGQKIMGCNVGTEIIVRPNGDIYPCTMLSQCGDRFKMGNVKDESLDTSIMEALVRQPSGCEGCSLKDACMGGCRYEKIARTGNLNIVNPCYCEQAKVIIPMIRERLSSLDSDTKEAVVRHTSQYIQWKACAGSEYSKEAWRYRERALYAET